jgi:hypothetical protein
MKKKIQTNFLPLGGRRSDCYQLSVNGQTYYLQLDKNGGICDMFPRIDRVFTMIRGRQMHDPNVNVYIFNTIENE